MMRAGGPDTSCIKRGRTMTQITNTARNDGFRSEMLAASEIVPHRVAITVTRSKVVARKSTLAVDVIPVWPDTIEEELVWRVDTCTAIKRRRKTIRFTAGDLRPTTPVLFLSCEE